MTITAREVQALKPGEWLTEKAARGEGRLQVRRLQNGDLSWYYRYTAPTGQRVRLVLGSALTLAEARATAEDRKRRYQSGDRALREAIADEHQQRQQAAAAERDRLAALARRGSLGDLLSAYADHLEATGRTSHVKVRASLTLHVKDAHPALWDKPAADVSIDDAVAIVGKLHAEGKDREAAKVRTYLRAAFTRAVNARANPAAPARLRDLGVTTIPVAALAAPEPITAGDDEQEAGTRERSLSVAELRAYWRRIDALPGPFGALLRLHLLTGAQRIEQLARCKVRDLDRDAATLVLLDTKGRRRQPRRHLVPLLPDAVRALDELRPEAEALGPYLFSADLGRTPASYHATRLRLLQVEATMLEADELPGGPFTPGDVRRTVETRLAAAGVSKEIRAQLQSHGLGGVQDKHYDRHKYLDEKRAALEALQRIMAEAPAEVVTFRRAGRR